MELAEIKVSYTPQNNKKIKFTNSDAIYSLVLKHWNTNTLELQEEMKVILLDRANQLIGIYVLSKGGIAGTVVDVKLLLSVALKCIASNIILVHNHPSGNLKPSQADISITKKVKKACKYVDIVLLDHLIISKNEYYSFADNRLL